MDGHAEVLARRSLLKYFYNQLEVAQRWDPASIFERCGQRFRLKQDISFHLYVSVLPCGDSKMFNGNKFVRPLVGIYSQEGRGRPLPAFSDIQSKDRHLLGVLFTVYIFNLNLVTAHWPCMSRKSEGLLRARLDTGESYSPLPEQANDPVVQRMRKVKRVICQ